ncbi:hypothetical protein [Sphingomonas baiyangensis]|uniref:Uncharacterized protein n=1 Tax=Sphingomonas baiyangensis TaxID=2572576 RepID=A0A4V5PUG9_9SPHN|nr:hypothetical protein [Sphingomonas baiyangensis]TKD50218.1 hypothetical protein FBR43_05205 [Sphingomonas baiyangensis]
MALSARYGGPYHAATASWPGTPVMDAGGSIVTPGTPVTSDCSAQVDAATEAMRQAEGYAEGDARILVLGLEALDTDARLTIAAGPHAGTWTLQSVELDPIAVGWVCRGRRAA